VGDRDRGVRPTRQTRPLLFDIAEPALKVIASSVEQDRPFAPHTQHLQSSRSRHLMGGDDTRGEAARPPRRRPDSASGRGMPAEP